MSTNNPQNSEQVPPQSVDAGTPKAVKDEVRAVSPFVGPLLVSGLFGLLAAGVIAGWIYGVSDSAGKSRPNAGGAVASSAALPHGGDAQHGRELFGTTCIACHGAAGTGIPHLGANLRDSKFVAGHSDDQLVAFIKQGRQPGDPNSVLGLMMPPKGGNPAFTDANLHDIVAFIRTLQDPKLMARAQ